MRVLRAGLSLLLLAGALHQFTALLLLDPSAPADTWVTRLLMFLGFMVLGVHGATPLFDHGAVTVRSVRPFRYALLVVSLVGASAYMIRFNDAPHPKVHNYAAVHLVVAVLYTVYFLVLLVGDVLLGSPRRFLRGTRLYD